VAVDVVLVVGLLRRRTREHIRRRRLGNWAGSGSLLSWVAEVGRVLN